MARPEAPIATDGPLGRFANALRTLRRDAGLPSYRYMSRLVAYSPASLSIAATGRELPSWRVTEAYVRACGGDVAHWRKSWERAREAVAQTQEIAEAAAGAGAHSSGGSGLDGPSVRLRILGPLQIISPREDASATGLMGRKERTLLAGLLLRANEHVSKQVLAESLWLDNPPAKAEESMQVYISRLRRILRTGLPDDCSLMSSPNGYRLQLTPGILDLHVFNDTLEDARRQREEGNLDDAAATLKSGLDLWSGEPLADVQGGEFIEASRQQLAERRMTAIKERLTLQMKLGEHPEVIDVLAGLVSSHPFDEELLALRMMALHGSGRSADALTAYRDFRRTLARELGISPGQRSELVQQKILRGDPDPLETTAPSTSMRRRTIILDDSSLTRRPAELPAAIPTVHGREVDLRALDTIAQSASRVAVITGMPGVGKTALAVRWAQAHRQDFPDGQIYVNLAKEVPREQDEGPHHALLRMLSSLGILGSHIPPDPTEQAALYRTLLADRKMLIFLDDAQSADQVLPLLPGSPTCMTIITARPMLTEIAVRVGAATVTLAPLNQKGGIALLTEALGSHRVEAERQKAVELIHLCGGLPLALQVASGYLRARPTWNLAMLVDSLTQRRPTDMRAGNLNIHSIIDAAYRGLPREAVRLLQLLATLPTRDFDVDTTAQVAQMSPAEAAATLSVLLESHMISEVSPGVYQCQELLRIFTGRLDETQQEAEPNEPANRPS